MNSPSCYLWLFINCQTEVQPLAYFPCSRIYQPAHSGISSNRVYYCPPAIGRSGGCHTQLFDIYCMDFQKKGNCQTSRFKLIQLFTLFVGCRSKMMPSFAVDPTSSAAHLSGCTAFTVNLVARELGLPRVLEYCREPDRTALKQQAGCRQMAGMRRNIQGSSALFWFIITWICDALFIDREGKLCLITENKMASLLRSQSNVF